MPQCSSLTKQKPLNCHKVTQLIKCYDACEFPQVLFDVICVVLFFVILYGFRYCYSYDFPYRFIDNNRSKVLFYVIYSCG